MMTPSVRPKLSVPCILAAGRWKGEVYGVSEESETGRTAAGLQFRYG